MELNVVDIGQCKIFHEKNRQDMLIIVIYITNLCLKYSQTFMNLIKKIINFYVDF